MTRAQEEEDIDGISCGCTRICVQPRNLARGTWWLTQKIYIIYNFLLISKFFLQTKILHKFTKEDNYILQLHWIKKDNWWRLTVHDQPALGPGLVQRCTGNTFVRPLMVKLGHLDVKTFSRWQICLWKKLKIREYNKLVLFVEVLDEDVHYFWIVYIIPVRNGRSSGGPGSSRWTSTRRPDPERGRRRPSSRSGLSCFGTPASRGWGRAWWSSQLVK